MSRSIRGLFALALVLVALAATACTDAAGPGSRSSPTCDIINGNTCLNHDATNGNT
jgi:ABC-type oligopeptide transport system substrate-binding subunit